VRAEKPVAEGGAAGSVTAPSEAGQGGSPEAAGAAGEAGTPSVPSGGNGGGEVATGGSGGNGGNGGSGGAVVSCQPTGIATALALDIPEVPQKVCRGAAVSNGFQGEADNTFTCCGSADVGYSVGISGLSNGDGGGRVGLVVPATAPLGAQSVTLDCAPGPVKYSFDFNVTDALPPVVTGADSAIFSNETLHISGSNLSGVTSVMAVSLEGNGVFSGPSCFINTDNVTDTAIECNFDGIGPGDYAIVVQQADCGAALATPKLTIKPLT
jgi:hypothetical protein